jgi:hypothetical protein
MRLRVENTVSKLTFVMRLETTCLCSAVVRLRYSRYRRASFKARLVLMNF